MAVGDDSLALKHLRSFLAAVDAGSQNRAAGRRRVAQSTVRKHLIEMQAFFGGDLFVPGQELRLTARGELVRLGAERLLSEFERMRDQVVRHQPIIKIGFNRAARPVLERGLRDLNRKRHGDRFGVQLFEMTSREQAMKLRNAELDLAVCYELDHLFDPAETVGHTTVTEQPYALVVPREAFRRGRIQLRALASLSYVHVPRTFRARVVEAGDAWLRDKGLRPRHRVECALATEILAHAGSGCGYGFAPALWSMAASEEVAFAPVVDFEPTATIAAYWQPQLGPTVAPLLKCLTAAARSGLAGFTAEA